MNVMVYNKFKDDLLKLNIDVMKSLEGVYNVDEIIDTFANFYYDKMILDITSIRDYQNTDNLQKLAMNINMENVIMVLEDTPETNNDSFISKLVALGVYNFTASADGVNYLLVHPRTYKEVANSHNLEDVTIKPIAPEPPKATTNANNNQFVQNTEEPKEDVALKNTEPQSKFKIIGFKDVTMHAGATSLIYMLKKVLDPYKKVTALEVNKVDFMYYNDPEMKSTTTADLLKDLMHKNTYDIIFVDLNDYEDTEICSEIYYLIEPSTIMINKMMKRNKGILETLKDKKIILNKCTLSNEDIATFEYETKLKVLFSIPPLNDRQEDYIVLKRFINKVNL